MARRRSKDSSAATICNSRSRTDPRLCTSRASAGSIKSAAPSNRHRPASAALGPRRRTELGGISSARIRIANLDLLEEAGIPPPNSPILTPEDREQLTGMALAQRQFYYVSTSFVGMVGGAAIAYPIAYYDEVGRIFQLAISGTGVARILSIINISRRPPLKYH